MNKVDELKNSLADLDSKLAQVKAGNKIENKEAVLGSAHAPYARKGEGSLSSRGFMFTKLIGLVSGVLQPDEAKVEADICQRLRKQYLGSAFNKSYGGRPSYLAPFATDMMVSDEAVKIDEEFKAELKSLTMASVEKFDPEELDFIRRKFYKVGKTNQSWIDQTLGGSLVAPAEFGELIQLLRNKDALINAGARVEALPPQGRLKLPRQTTPTTGYYIGENSQITSSNFGTGFLELSAKKVACLVTLPNELLRYGGPATEAILRGDMTKTLSLTMDYQLLYGEGSDIYPLGLVNTPNIATVTPSDTSNTQLSPGDLYAFASAIEANNGELESFIMRPEMFYDFCAARASTYNGSTTAAVGQFVYDQFRELGSPMKKVVAGYPVVTTSQVSITRQVSGGSANGTTVIGGQFSDYVIAMFGSIEFAQATQGDTAFANDQTVVRAILSHDGAARHPGVFAVADGVLLSVGV